MRERESERERDTANVVTEQGLGSQIASSDRSFDSHSATKTETVRRLAQLLCPSGTVQHVRTDVVARA